MRTAVSAAARPMGVRAITGVAPVLHFATAKPTAPKDEQVRRNTDVALEMIRRFKGDLPKAYTRRHSQSFEEVEREIEVLLGGAEKMRRAVTDDQPMDKLAVMERCLRHGVWNYLKDEGKMNFAEMEKWLVYTGTDESRLNQLRREHELKEKYAAFKQRRAAAGGPTACLPKFNWAQEYSQVIDREVVAEKRVRYDTLAANTTEKNDAEVEALLTQYRKPMQEERLDKLVDMLERFKPVLAREAIMQRLTIKHLEGQLGVWRYMDWCPEVRDRAELEADNYCQQWWYELEEKRMMAIRMRSKNEVISVMEKKQADAMASTQTTAVASTGGEDERRVKLLQEVLALQSRIGKKDAEEKKAE